MSQCHSRRITIWINISDTRRRKEISLLGQLVSFPRCTGTVPYLLTFTISIKRKESSFPSFIVPSFYTASIHSARTVRLWTNRPARAPTWKEKKKADFREGSRRTGGNKIIIWTERERERESKKILSVAQAGFERLYSQLGRALLLTSFVSKRWGCRII